MLGSQYNRSSRSLNALSDGWDPVPVSEWIKYKYCSSDMNFYLTETSLQSPLQGNGNGSITAASAFDPFVTASPLSATGGVGAVSTNPYAHDATALGGATFFASQTGFQQPVCAIQPSTVSIGLIKSVAGPISSLCSYRPTQSEHPWLPTQRSRPLPSQRFP
jgi:hypothetical protein